MIVEIGAGPSNPTSRFLANYVLEHVAGLRVMEVRIIEKEPSYGRMHPLLF